MRTVFCSSCEELIDKLKKQIGGNTPKDIDHSFIYISVNKNLCDSFAENDIFNNFADQVEEFIKQFSKIKIILSSGKKFTDICKSIVDEVGTDAEIRENKRGGIPNLIYAKIGKIEHIVFQGPEYLSGTYIYTYGKPAKSRSIGAEINNHFICLWNDAETLYDNAHFRRKIDAQNSLCEVVSDSAEPLWQCLEFDRISNYFLHDCNLDELKTKHFYNISVHTKRTHRNIPKSDVPCGYLKNREENINEGFIIYTMYYNTSSDKFYRHSPIYHTTADINEIALSTVSAKNCSSQDYKEYLDIIEKSHGKQKDTPLVCFIVLNIKNIVSKTIVDISANDSGYLKNYC